MVVTALRREEAPQQAPDANKPILDAAETVQTETLDPIAGASAAIDKAEAAKAAAPEFKIAEPASPAAPPTPAASGGAVIQIGIFSVEANASRAADKLTKAGVAVSVRKETSQGKTFWSVTARGDAAVLAKIKQAGFADAYILKH